MVFNSTYALCGFAKVAVAIMDSFHRTHLSILLAWLGRQRQLLRLPVDLRCRRHLLVDIHCSGYPMPAEPVSGHPMPAAPASGHSMPAGVGAGLPPPPTLPDSLFMAYCPERPGGPRPDGYFNSQSENWDSHEGPRQ